MIRSALLYVMLKRLLRELAITAVICFGERVLERVLLPGLNRMPGHVAAADPSRADDVSTMIAEAFALLALVWLFNGTLYVIGYLKRVPLRPQVPPLVGLVIALLTFVGGREGENHRLGGTPDGIANQQPPAISLRALRKRMCTMRQGALHARVV